jgi:uncharacterized LabA/DUF88 family protein
MERFAVFVDAGYLFASSKAYYPETHHDDSYDVRVDFQQFIAVITDLAESITDNQILRIYWYDASEDGLPTKPQEALAFMDYIKLRLGMFNSAGQQKGVDTLIVSDMISLARNRAISDAILVSGDVDLLVGVQQAQELGVRVHLIGVEAGHQRNQSARLKWDCDTTRNIPDEDVRAFALLQQRRESGEFQRIPTGEHHVHTPSRRESGEFTRVSPGATLRSAPSTINPVAIPPDEVDWPHVASQIVEILPDSDRAAIARMTRKYSRWNPRIHGRMLGICKSIIHRETLHDEQQPLRDLVQKLCRAEAAEAAAAAAIPVPSEPDADAELHVETLAESLSNDISEPFDDDDDD